MYKSASRYVKSRTSHGSPPLVGLSKFSKGARHRIKFFKGEMKLQKRLMNYKNQTVLFSVAMLTSLHDDLKRMINIMGGGKQAGRKKVQNKLQTRINYYYAMMKDVEKKLSNRRVETSAVSLSNSN